MPMRFINIEEFKRDTPDLSIRRLRFVLKEAHQEMGEAWREMLPTHFSPQAKSLYGYKPRTAKYLKWKRAMGAVGKAQDGGRQDLVLTGNLRSAVLGRRPKIAAYPTRCTVTLSGPRYLTINYRPGRPNLGQEILAVAPGELQILATRAGARLQRALAAVSQVERRRR